MTTATLPERRVSLPSAVRRVRIGSGQRWNIRMHAAPVGPGRILRTIDGARKEGLPAATRTGSARPVRPPALVHGTRQPVLAWVGGDARLRLASGWEPQVEVVARAGNASTPAAFASERGTQLAWVEPGRGIRLAKRSGEGWTQTAVAGAPGVPASPLAADGNADSDEALLAWVDKDRRLVVARVRDGRVVASARGDEAVAGTPAIRASSPPLVAYRTAAGQARVQAFVDGLLQPCPLSPQPRPALGNPQLHGGPRGYQVHLRGVDGRRHVLHGARA